MAKARGNTTPGLEHPLPPDHPLLIPRTDTKPIPGFREESGLGNTLTYKFIGNGTLDTVTVGDDEDGGGKRRLIVMESWRRYLLDRLRKGAPPSATKDAWKPPIARRPYHRRRKGGVRAA
jgi:hypothetical protein